LSEQKESLSDTAESPSSASGSSGTNDNIVYSWLLIAMLFFSGCDEEYTPRPRGYFRIDFPEKKYERVETGSCPYIFEKPVYAKLVPDTSPSAEPCWFNLEFETLHATVYISYKKVDNNLTELLEDHRRITMKHIPVASGINEEALINKSKNVYGLIQYVKGNAASPLQFYVTDSVHHFLRGSLYFYAIPNPDSIAPVEKFVTDDINHMLNTVEWR
jgi:gliding motility-associated lipoprotein GldD